MKGTRIVLEEALAAEVERVVHTSSVAAIGPAKPRGTADESQPFSAGYLGIAYVNSKHEAEVEALRLAAHGLAVVIVNPSFVLGPDDPKGTSMELVRRFLLGRIPAYVDGGLNIVDVRDVAQGHLLADEKGETGRALHPRRPKLHPRSAVRRLRPDLRVATGPPVKLPARPTALAVERWRGSGCRSPSRPTRCGRRRSGGPTATRRRAGSSASSRDPTRRRSRTPCGGRWTSSATACRTGRGPQEAALAAVAPLLRLGGRVLGMLSRK